MFDFYKRHGNTFYEYICQFRSCCSVQHTYDVVSNLLQLILIINLCLNLIGTLTFYGKLNSYISGSVLHFRSIIYCSIEDNDKCYLWNRLPLGNPTNLVGPAAQLNSRGVKMHRRPMNFSEYTNYGSSFKRINVKRNKPKFVKTSVGWRANPYK